MRGPGAILWGFAAGSSVNAAPAVVDGSVYWGSGYSKSGAEGSGNTKLYAFGLALPLLASEIKGMGLDVGTTISLTSRLNAIELKLELGRDVCGDLGGFVRKVTDEAGKAHSEPDGRASPGDRRSGELGRGPARLRRPQEVRRGSNVIWTSVAVSASRLAGRARARPAR